MSEIFKKFKSVFIVEEEGAKSAAPVPATSNPVAAAPVAKPVGSPVPEVRTAAPGQGTVSDKFVEILMGALEKNNQAGFDYFEFRQALRNLAKMPMDEQTRYQSANAMAQTMGVTPATLIESAKFYINVLQNEESKFKEAHAQQRGKLIGNREEQIKTLEAAIQQKTEQIKQLTQQIEEHRHQSEQIRKEVNDNTVKIETTKADFDATFAAVIGQIQEDMAKIQQYLK